MTEEISSLSLQKDSQVITFGCRLNAYESEVMRDHVRHQGLTNTIVINTCAVTNEAERQGRQAIRRMKRQYPNARIIVTGCSAQIRPEIYAEMPEVDRVLGNTEKMQRASFHFGETSKIHVTDIMAVQETAHHLISGFENKVRAFIQIQNGCNHRCTFCRIPYGRGRNRSVPVSLIVNQVRTLMKNGCQEVVFTGVDITEYGRDFPDPLSLSALIREVLREVPSLPRLRLSSLDPAEVDEDFFSLVAAESRLMPHFHLSLQAGDDLILKRMKRRHLRSQAIHFCQRLLDIRPEAVLGADLIAGFPTETDDMFLNTLKIIQECSLTYLHVFPYSAVEGTPAARMPQLPPSTIKKRAALLRKAGERTLENTLKSHVGSQKTVLIEKENQGYAEDYTYVHVVSETCLPLGTLARVDIRGHTPTALIGVLNPL